MTIFCWLSIILSDPLLSVSVKKWFNYWLHSCSLASEYEQALKRCLWPSSKHIAAWLWVIKADSTLSHKAISEWQTHPFQAPSPNTLPLAHSLLMTKAYMKWHWLDLEGRRRKSSRKKGAGIAHKRQTPEANTKRLFTSRYKQPTIHFVYF